MGVIANWPSGVEHGQHAGSAPRCFSAQRSLTAAAETCISMPYSNFWLRRNTGNAGQGNDGVKIGARQQLGLTLFEPLPGLGPWHWGMPVRQQW